MGHQAGRKNHGTRVFQEVHGTGVLSKLQQRHSGSRLRPLHVFGPRYAVFSFAVFNITKAKLS